MIKNLIHSLLLVGLGVASGLALLATPVSADNHGGPKCGGADTSIIACNEGPGEGAVIYLLRFMIQLMTMGVGILAVGGIVYAGILYASAAGSQEQVKKAKMMMFNVAVGLVAYAFMFGITNYLIPGGVFN